MARGYAFRGSESDTIYMVRCLKCGGEVPGPGVAFGGCYLCGYNVNEDPVMLEKVRVAGELRVEIP